MQERTTRARARALALQAAESIFHDILFPEWRLITVMTLERKKKREKGREQGGGRREEREQHISSRGFFLRVFLFFARYYSRTSISTLDKIEREKPLIISVRRKRRSFINMRIYKSICFFFFYTVSAFCSSASCEISIAMNERDTGKQSRIVNNKI